jgi:hypothetical protein
MFTRGPEGVSMMGVRSGRTSARRLIAWRLVDGGSLRRGILWRVYEMGAVDAGVRTRRVLSLIQWAIARSVHTGPIARRAMGLGSLPRLYH